MPSAAALLVSGTGTTTVSPSMTTLLQPRQILAEAFGSDRRSFSSCWPRWRNRPIRRSNGPEWGGERREPHLSS